MKKSTINFVLVLLLIFLLTDYSVKAEELIAIVGTSPRTNIQADMAIVKGAKANLNFVERGQIRKVLAEQKLSRSGLVRPESIIRIGRLLNADIVVLVKDDRINYKLPGNIIIFNVKNGIRLEDRLLRNNDFKRAVNEILQIIRDGLTKNESLQLNKTKFISFLPVNMLSQDEKSIRSVQLVQQNLKRDLLRQKQYLLLERDLIDLLLQEKLLNSKALDNLKSCSYAVEIEAKIVDSRNKKLLLTAYLKNSQGQIEKEVKKDYTAGKELETAKEMADTFLKIVLGEAVSRKNVVIKQNERKNEAQVFLSDSKEALNEHDYLKSFTSLKNAYMLNPGLKNEVNKLIISLLSPGSSKISQAACSREVNHEQIAKYGKFYLDLLEFYHDINGRYLSSARIINFMSMREDMKEQYRGYYDRCIIAEVNRLKQKYDYKSKPKGSKEYFENYTNYLSELFPLINVKWTCEYWLTYFASDFLEYIKEISALGPQKLSQFKYFNAHKYYSIAEVKNSAGDFMPEAYNMLIDVYEHMFNSPILEWKWVAKKQLEALRRSNGRARNRFSYYYLLIEHLKPYSVEGVLKNQDYEFIKQVAKYAVGASVKERIVCDRILGRSDTFRDYVYIDGKLNTELFTLFVKTGFNDPVRYFIRSVQTNFPYGPYNKKTYKIPQYVQYEQLLKIVERYGNKYAKLFTLGDLRMRIKYDKKRLGIENNNSGLDIFMEKNINVLTKTFFRRAPFPLIIGSLQENNIVYTLITDEHSTSTALAKTNLSDDNFKTVVGKTLSPKRGRSRWGSARRSICISPQYIVYVNNKSQLILYPKNGDKPELVTFEEGLSGRNVSNIFYANGKVYIFTDSFGIYENVRPFEVIAFDIKSRSFGVVFSAKQEKDNPFKEYSAIYLKYGAKAFFDQKTNNVIVPLFVEKGDRRKGNWRYGTIVTSLNIVSGKWKWPVIYKSGDFSATLCCIDKNIIMEYAYPTFRIIDYSKSHEAIKKIAGFYGIKQIRYENDHARIMFNILKDKDERFRAIICNGINSTFMYNKHQAVFLKQGMYLNFASHDKYKHISKHLDFDYKNKSYSIYSILDQKAFTLKLYVCEYKSPDEILKGKNKDNSITYRAKGVLYVSYR